MMPPMLNTPTSPTPISNGRRVISTGKWRVMPLETSLGFEHFPPKLPRVMVPINSGRSLQLHTPAQGPVAITNAWDNGMIGDWLGLPCCRAALTGKLLYVYGLNRPCRIAIELQQGDSQFSIMVTLKATLEVPIIAHYVEHGPLRKTKMTSAMLGEMINAANRILEPQANVRLVLDREGVLPHTLLDKALGKTVRSAPHTKGDESPFLTEHAIHTGKPNLLNLFLVRRLDAPGESSPRAETANGCCILEDHISGGRLNGPEAGRTLAHEIGHHFDLDDLTDDRDMDFLMYESAGAGSISISADDADKINPSGVGIRR